MIPVWVSKGADTGSPKQPRGRPNKEEPPRASDTKSTSGTREVVFPGRKSFILRSAALAELRSLWLHNPVNPAPFTRIKHCSHPGITQASFHKMIFPHWKSPKPPFVPDWPVLELPHKMIPHSDSSPRTGQGISPPVHHPPVVTHRIHQKRGRNATGK